MAGLVRVEDDGAIRVVSLNRPEKRNALSIELRRELATILTRLGADPGVAVVVLRGEGPVFSAGMDTSQFGGDDDNRRALFESTLGLFTALRSLPRPVIAALHGAAPAGAFALAAHCDIRIAAPGTQFWIPEITMGFAQSWATLRRVLPDQIARRVAFTGERFDAEQAREWGFVMEIADDPTARALELARQMAENPISGLADTKRLMVEAEDPALRAAADAEMRIFAASLFRQRD